MGLCIKSIASFMLWTRQYVSQTVICTYCKGKYVSFNIKPQSMFHCVWFLSYRCKCNPSPQSDICPNEWNILYNEFVDTFHTYTTYKTTRFYILGTKGVFALWTQIYMWFYLWYIYVDMWDTKEHMSLNIWKSRTCHDPPWLSCLS